MLETFQAQRLPDSCRGQALVMGSSLTSFARDGSGAENMSEVAEGPMDVSLLRDYDEEMADDAALVVGGIGHEGDYCDSSSEEELSGGSSEEESESDLEDDEMADDEEDPRNEHIRKLERKLKTALQKSRRRKEKITTLTTLVIMQLRNQR